MLVEFPFNARPAYCLEILKRLKLESIIPVIAHPERNRNFLNCLGVLVAFVKTGCLIQIDAASIAGVYGLKIKEFAKRLIRLNLADLVASNAHCANDYSNWYMEAYKNVIQWSGQENANRLFIQNAKKIIDSSDESHYKNVIGLRGDVL